MFDGGLATPLHADLELEKSFLGFATVRAPGLLQPGDVAVGIDVGVPDSVATVLFHPLDRAGYPSMLERVVCPSPGFTTRSAGVIELARDRRRRGAAR